MSRADIGGKDAQHAGYVAAAALIARGRLVSVRHAANQLAAVPTRVAFVLVNRHGASLAGLMFGLYCSRGDETRRVSAAGAYGTVIRPSEADRRRRG